MALHEYQKQMYKKVGIIVALIALPVAGFFTGVAYQKQTGGTAQDTTAQVQKGRFGGMFRNRAIGTVKSISSTSITVTGRNGTDRTLTITSSTTYMNGTSSAQASDIQVGATVLVMLDSNDNTKATQITINPTLQFPQPGAQGSSGNSSNPSTSDGNAVLQ